MNPQREKLERQLAHVEEEMKILSQKFERIKYRYKQLEKEREALKVDLQGLQTKTTKRQDLQSTQIRKLNLSSAKNGQ